MRNTIIITTFILGVASIPLLGAKEVKQPTPRVTAHQHLENIWIITVDNTQYLATSHGGLVKL